MSARAQTARGYRLKPAPRSRGGRSASRVHWDKIGRVLMVLVLFVVLALYVGPTINFLDAWRDSRAEQAQLEQLKADNAELRARSLTLSDPDAAENAARKLGMVAQGERSYVIRGLND